MAENKAAAKQVVKSNQWEIKMVGIDRPKTVKDIEGTILSLKSGFKLIVVKFEINNKGTETSNLEIDINQLSVVDSQGRTYPPFGQRVFSYDYFPNYVEEAGIIIKEPARIEWLLKKEKNENKVWLLDIKPNLAVPFAVLFVVPEDKKLQKVKWSGLPEIKVSD